LTAPVALEARDVKVSLVIVCHRSAQVIRDCVTSFRREAAAAGVEAEVVAVEQSEDENEASGLRDAGVDLLIERPNRGYAAGLNTGATAAGGEIFLLANPDLRFFPGSLEALLDGIRHGFDVVGPQFVWDDDAVVRLPPAEDPSPRAALSRTLRRRWRWAWRAGLAGAVEDSLRAWTARTTISVNALRGALLAVSRDAWLRFGPFDEGYFLFYEETEWLWRARRRGARLGLAAGARVQHRWGHSTGNDGRIAEREQASRRRFEARNYGPLWRGILWASGGGDRPPIAVTPLADDGVIPQLEADVWLASPFHHLLPAIGTVGAPLPPSEFLDFCRDRRWVVAAAVRERHHWRVTGAWRWNR
jgi:GT2 family glycosyltransferase